MTQLCPSLAKDARGHSNRCHLNHAAICMRRRKKRDDDEDEDDEEEDDDDMWKLKKKKKPIPQSSLTCTQLQSPHSQSGLQAQVPH